MIGHLEGLVLAIRPGFLILSVQGVGYKVTVTKTALTSIALNEKLSLWTHLAVREDALDLYGFATEEEHHFFNLLLTVSGIGPKSAIAILDVASVETLRNAIAHGNAGYLTNISGIGKKTAEKIIIELRDKVGLAVEGAGGALKGDAEALEAMKSLGYSPQEAREALRHVPHTITNSNDRLREALKIMGAR